MGAPPILDNSDLINDNYALGRKVVLKHTGRDVTKAIEILEVIIKLELALKHLF